MKRSLYLFALLVLIASCKKEAKVKLPDTKPLPVMYCYICPDDTVISLRLTMSQPIYSGAQGDLFAPIADADVRISGAQGSAQLVYDQLSMDYRLKTNVYPIAYGASYKITVTTSKGELATAETQVPAGIVPITTLSVERVVEKYGSYDRVKIEFNDAGGINNYYRVAGVYALVYPWQPDTILQDAFINELYSDNGHDAEAAQITVRIYEPYDSIPFYDFYLYNCNLPYYNFHRSLRNYTGDNPFAEPSLIYTNVQGGFGCFGAYTRSRFRYKK
jgi:hypothetical protein